MFTSWLRSAQWRSIPRTSPSAPEESAFPTSSPSLGSKVPWHGSGYELVMLLLRSLALLALTLPLACGSSTGSDHATGSAGAPGEAGDTTPDDTDDTDDTTPTDGTDDGADFNTISQCETDTEFEYVYATLSPNYDPGEPIDWDANGFRDMLLALSERRPGKYRIEVSYSRGLDGASVTSVLLIGDSGSALHVHSSSFSYYHGGSGTSYWTAEECELQPPSFFEACLVDDESLESCADPSVGVSPNILAWLASCSPAEAVCR